ncbi:phthiocerol type I polyketide synthase PpsA [soil metagenome]
MTSWGDEAGLRNWLVDYLVTVIGCNPEQIDLDAPLNELGIGSRDAVVLSGELTELLGRPVSPVDFWQNPTINALAHGLAHPDAQPVPTSRPAGPGRDGLQEPIAVIGLGCRLPGDGADIQGPEAFWQFLAERRSSVSTVPGQRWQAFDDGSADTGAALARTTRWGSFLADVARFDAEYFDISPSEAARIDPQQRLLLEVAVEALDHAGIPAESLRRSHTGVFAGACVSEYGVLAARDLGGIDAWTGTGGALSVIANRLSYVLDLRGPSMTVDTACSSSLVAIHLACKSLRTGESDLAIAAGVNLVLSPAVTRSFDAAEAMSVSGACRSFDAGADGFVRGEGCGAVVLKRLSEALRDGDRVLAVVRGSAINSDGRSNGLMAPNPAAQTAVLRAACDDAGVSPLDVDYVEAHGTGTLLGDPIEARGLGSVYGRGRGPDAPLLIGAVKSNIGHLEAAAGVVGFIKATLAVQRGRIPANLHFDAPNPHIPFGDLRLRVVDQPTSWPSTDHPRLAGVSSFGFGGTNAHLVLEQAPMPAAIPMRLADAPVTTLVVSAKTPQRVARSAHALADWMAGPGAMVPIADIAHTLNHHRTKHTCFATVAATGREGALAGLAALAQGRAGPGVTPPHQGHCRPGVVFVYSGQGSQWVGMGQQLLADEPAFAAAVDDLEPDFVAAAGFSLRDVLAEGEQLVGIDRIQPVLVAVQLALTALWRSYGIQPDAVLGHSMGEVTAAVVSGALSPAEGFQVICTRSTLMARLAGQGAMALVELSGTAAEELVADDPELTVAVYASPRQSVIAGPPAKIDALVTELSARDRLARLIDVDVASHHPTVDPVLAELRSQLADLMPGFPSIPVFCTTAGHESDPVFDAQHWVDNLRNPVQFTQAVTAAAAQHGVFIEVSPHPLLTYAIDDTVETHHHSIATLQRDTDDALTFHTNLNAAHTTHPPQTPHLPEPHPQVPSIPWEHTRHWLPETPPVRTTERAPAPGTLLGDQLSVAATPPVQLWQATLVPAATPYPGPHALHGVAVIPASVLCQTLLTAAGGQAVSEVQLLAPVVLDQPRFIQVIADAETVTVSSCVDRTAPAQRWVRHVSARLGGDTAAGAPIPTPSHAESQEPLHLSVSDFLADRGIDGPPFAWTLLSASTAPDALTVDVALPDTSTVAALDAALHVAPLAGAAADTLLRVPAAVEMIVVLGELPDARATVTVRRTAGADLTVDITVAAADGTPCVLLQGVRYVPLGGPAGSTRGQDDPRRFAHRISWVPQPADSSAALPFSGDFAVVGPDGAANAELASQLVALGHRSVPEDTARYVLYAAAPSAASDLDASSDLDDSVELTAEVTALVQRLVHRGDAASVTLWVLTQGVREAADTHALRQSCLWGLAGVIAAEQPQIWGALVDLDARTVPGDWLPVLLSQLPTSSTSVLALRGTELLVPQLVPLEGPATRPVVSCRADAAYLISGGLGALGLVIANWLADRGARRLVLAGRTPLPPRRHWDTASDPAIRGRVAAIRALEARGVTVEAVALDVGTSGAITDLLNRRDGAAAAPIRGVVHAAGVTHNQLLTDVDSDALRTVMAPKIAGAQWLHQAFPAAEVDFFFVVSSAATMFGIPGQAGYAAANAYLDALARARHHDGGLTQSIDWVAWRGLGFGADAPLVVAELERLGSRPIEPDEALVAWEHVSTYDVAQAVVLPVSVAPVSGLAASTLHVSTTAADWARLPIEEIRSRLRDGLRTILADELRMAETELHLDVPFAELGLNSIMAMSIRREAELLVGLELSATMLWNHPTVSALAAHLADKVAPQPVSAAEETTAVPADPNAGLLDDLFSSVEAGIGSGDDTL